MGTRKIYTEQIQFPATAVPSADVNCLDDYEEGTWTPVFTFATPGNLAVTYTAQLGWYTKIGNLVSVSFTIVTSSFTHTTASGTAQVSGMPFAASADSGYFSFGPLVWQGITKANYTQISCRAIASSATMDFSCSGSAQAVSGLAFGDMPSGGAVILRGQLTYRAPT